VRSLGREDAIDERSISDSLRAISSRISSSSRRESPRRVLRHAGCATQRVQPLAHARSLLRAASRSAPTSASLSSRAAPARACELDRPSARRSSAITGWPTASHMRLTCRFAPRAAAARSGVGDHPNPRGSAAAILELDAVAERRERRLARAPPRSGPGILRHLVAGVREQVRELAVVVSRISRAVGVEPPTGYSRRGSSISETTVGDVGVARRGSTPPLVQRVDDARLDTLGARPSSSTRSPPLTSRAGSSSRRRRRGRPARTSSVAAGEAHRSGPGIGEAHHLQP